ncbi:MAG TPA: DUF485 domain-containing protein [Mycobacteriales bacterium]|jgi:uncharacterized membrane protein (DUF485 family)|nr:DUF485 domain-containing protein [Mycobacteriales bacterium]
MSTDAPDRLVPDAERYSAMAASAEFDALRRALRSFVFPMTIAFLAWYLLYVLLSAYARGFMGAKVAGNINVAFVFGVLQFVSTFLIAWWYSRYAATKIDPIASRLRHELESGDAR